MCVYENECLHLFMFVRLSGQCGFKYLWCSRIEDENESETKRKYKSSIIKPFIVFANCVTCDYCNNFTLWRHLFLTMITATPTTTTIRMITGWENWQKRMALGKDIQGKRIFLTTPPSRIMYYFVWIVYSFTLS